MEIEVSELKRKKRVFTNYKKYRKKAKDFSRPGLILNITDMVCI